MRGRAVFGGVIIGILLLGFVYGLTVPLIYDPSWVRRRDWKASEIDIITYQELRREDVRGVVNVDLNIRVRYGSLTCNFTDSPYVYQLVFRTDVEAEKPIVYHIRRGNTVSVDVILDNGDAKLQLSKYYSYNGTVEWRAGGMQITLNKHTRIDSLQLKIRYLGFISIDIMDKAMFNLLDVEVNTGGVNIRVDANDLYGRGEVRTSLIVGGVLIPSIVTGRGVGVKASMDVDIGGLNLKTAGFNVYDKTLTSIELRSENYEYAYSKLDLNLKIGFGGISFNLPPYQLSTEEPILR